MFPSCPLHPTRLSPAIKLLYSPGIRSEHNFTFSKNRLSQTATNFFSSSSLSLWGASEHYIMKQRNQYQLVAVTWGLITQRIEREYALYTKKCNMYVKSNLLQIRHTNILSTDDTSMQMESRKIFLTETKK